MKIFFQFVRASVLQNLQFFFLSAFREETLNGLQTRILSLKCSPKKQENTGEFDYQLRKLPSVNAFNFDASVEIGFYVTGLIMKEYLDSLTGWYA